MDQLEIDIEALLDAYKKPSTPIKSRVFEATLATEATISPAKNSNKAALLQINIADETHASEQLAAALELLSKEFSAVTIFIDMQLALVVYSIIMPYMTADQLQDMVARKKLDWIAKNISAISKINVPWSIVSDEEQRIEQSKNENLLEISQLFKSNNTFKKNIIADVEILKVLPPPTK